MSRDGASPSDCDLLVSGGLVITLDAENRVFSDGAAAIRGDTILAVGRSAEIERRFSPKQRIDGGDHVTLPGLVNAHNHTPLSLVRGMIEDRNFAPSYTRGIPEVHALSFEETLVLSRLGVYELLRGGVTTIVDYFRHPRALVQAVEEIGLRAVIGGRIHDADTEALAQGRYEHRTDIGLSTLQETLDLMGEPRFRNNDRIRIDFAPHAADTCSKSLLAQVAAAVDAHGGNVHTHLAQSRGEIAHVLERDGLAPDEVFAEVGLLDSRLIAAHCVFLGPDEVSRIGRAGVSVAHAPHQNAIAGNIAPILDLEAAGARIVLCTDTRSSDLFEAMRLAVASARIRRNQFEPKASQLLRWATTSAAAAIGMEDRIGSIEPGRKADLILLDRREPNLAPMVDGVGIIVYSGHAQNVDTVIVDGEILLREGRPTSIEGNSIVLEAQAVAARLWESSGVRPLSAM